MAISKSAPAPKSTAKASSKISRPSTAKAKVSTPKSVGKSAKSSAVSKVKSVDSAKVSKEARSKEEVSRDHQEHIKALEKSLGIELQPPSDQKSEADAPSTVGSIQKGADTSKVAAERIKGAGSAIQKASKAFKKSVGVRTAVEEAGKLTHSKAGNVSKGAHGVAALTGAANLVMNGSQMDATQLAATGSGVLADTAGALESGGKLASGASKFGKVVGAVGKGASKVAGPLGIAAKGFEGVSQMVDGKDKSTRAEGAFKTVTALGVGQVSAAAWVGGAAKFAARTNVVGAAAISGIEGVGQLTRAKSTQDYIAGGLKTGAGAALAAAAIPGPHSIPLAIAGAGMYVGGIAADNWDSITAGASWVGNKVGSLF